MRGQSPGWEPETGVDAAFELDNRGKRGVALSLEQPDAVEAVHRLVEQADIFITNLTAPRIARYDLSAERLQEIKPDLIYVVLTGYGTRGPDAAMGAFDYSAFWSRSGIMGLIGDPDGPPMPCRPGQGDHTTSLNLLAATLAALRLRDQTGEGQRVEVTLQTHGRVDDRRRHVGGADYRPAARADRPGATGQPTVQFIRSGGRALADAGDAHLGPPLAADLSGDGATGLDR